MKTMLGVTLALLLICQLDTVQADTLSLDEYKTGLRGQDDLETRFKNFDQNGDGKLTREEFVRPSAK